MNEHRQDVQLSHSTSNASASSSLTSLDTVVLVAPPVQPDKVHASSPQPPPLTCCLPSSTSNSSDKTVSTSSSTNSRTTSSNSAISSNASSYSSTPTSATSNSASYDSSSCSSFSNSPSSSLSSPSSSPPASRMPRKPGGSSKRRRNSDSSTALGRKEEELVETLLPPPTKVERSEDDGEKCECCCYCSWQSVVPEPVVLVSCGSFNPITTMHLRMMELARDAVEKTWSFQQLPPEVGTPLKQPEVLASSSTTKTGADKSPSSTSLLNPRRQIVVAGIISPVSDGYAKHGLASAESRCRLARLACSTTSDWLAVDSWEASKPEWTPTRRVLDRIQSRLHYITGRLDSETGVFGVDASLPKKGNFDDMEDPRFGETTGSQKEDESMQRSGGSATNAWLSAHLLIVRKTEAKAIGASQGRAGGRCCCTRKGSLPNASVLPPVRVKLVCGADLLESLLTPNLWSEEDITALVRDYGIVCISRPGSNAARLLYEKDILSRYEQNVILATEWSQNGLSATIVRRALARGQSVRYLVPDAALEEIYARGLYGATKPSRPSLLLLVPPSPPPTTHLPAQNVLTVPPQTSAQPSEDDDIGSETMAHRNLQDPSTCLTEDKKVMGPLSKSSIPTSEKGTNSLYIETRSHYVQTRLSSIPSPQTSGTMTTSATSGTGGRDTPLILHRVTVDPSVEKGAYEGGLTAILPLLKQCTRCGSQRVRLLLVERPPAPSHTLPAPPPVPMTPVVHAPRPHSQHRHHHHRHGDRWHETMILSKKFEEKKELKVLPLEQHARHQRPMLPMRSMTQPITLPSGLSGRKSQKVADATTAKTVERTRGETTRQPCAHYHHFIPKIPPPTSHQPSHHHQHQNRRSLDGLNNVSRGRSLPRDLRTSFVLRQQPSRRPHEQHHHNHHQQSLKVTKSPSQETPTSSQRMNSATTKSFQTGSVKQRTRRHERPCAGPPEPRLEGDGAAAPTSSSVRGGTVVCLPHYHTQLHPRHLLSPPAVESQPIPPVLLVPRSRRSPTSITSRTTTKPSTTPISLSQPMLTQTSTAGRPLRRTYDEVDYLLYNLCLNIESAL